MANHSEKRSLRIRRRAAPTDIDATERSLEYDTAQPISDISLEEEPPAGSSVEPIFQSSPAKKADKGPSWGIQAVARPRQERMKKEKKAEKPLGKENSGGGLFRKKEKTPMEDSPLPEQPAKRKRGLFFGKKKKDGELLALNTGTITVSDLLAPAGVDLTHRDRVEVNGLCHACLYVTGYGYNTVVGSGWLAPLIEAGEGVNVSFFLHRQPKDKILAAVSRTTMFNRSRMRDVGDTRQDFEELDSAIHSGLYLKEGINRGGEDFYYMHTLLNIEAPDPETLEERVAAIETLCTSMDMSTRRCDYLHGQGFLSSLPLLSLDGDIERKSRRNVLTYGAAAAFPFSSYELFDQTGVLLGINMHNRSVCMIDPYDDRKYPNANFCVFGMTGAGKTFLLQLMALRLRQQGVKVMFIAPVKGFELRPGCESIGGNYIKLAPSSMDQINWLEIRKPSLDIDAALGRSRGDSLVADKIAKTQILMGLLKRDISIQEKALLDDALVECYGRYDLTLDNSTLFEADGSFRPMPTLKDLHEILRGNERTMDLALALSRLSRWMGGPTNVDLSNDYIVFDISDVDTDMLPVVEMIVTDYCRDECMRDRIRKKAIFLDELWSIIGASSNGEVASYVLELFKTVRGLGGMCVGTSQDFSDFFALEGGKYGRGIVNACRFKVVLPLEEDEAMVVKTALKLSEEETLQIIRNRRGEGLLCAGNNRICVAFQSSRLEYECITTSRADLERQMHGV